MFIKKNIFRVRFFILLIIILTLQIAGFGQKERDYKILTVPDEIAKKDFFPFGGYLIFGKKPVGFSDFYSFSIENTNLEKKSGEIKIVGAVMTNLKDENNIYRMETIALSPNNLSFKTETLNKIRYEFNGKYLKKGDLRRFYKIHTKVLQGKLTKFLENKEQESANITFYFKVWKADSYYKSN